MTVGSIMWIVAPLEAPPQNSAGSAAGETQNAPSGDPGPGVETPDEETSS
jgi:hypothetical protein